jgi:phenylalanyl-tRNA synthetase alpha subunit
MYCTEKYLKKLMGRTEIEDALKRLDKLTQEESQMAAAQILKVTHTVDSRVQQTANDVDQLKRWSSNIISADY